MAFSTTGQGRRHWEERISQPVRRAANCATEHAYAIAAGWLAEVVSGQPLESLERPWPHADRLLRRPPQTAQRVNRLADHLLQAGGLSRETLDTFLRQRRTD